MRPDLFLATIGRGSNGSNALEVTEDRAAVTAESQDNIINRVNNISQYGPSWHYVPGIGVAGTAYSEVPGSALGDLAFSRASSKTRTNSAGVVETIASNVPPHDYRNADGTLSTFPRLNLEPQRTNSIRNSSMVGAVAGTPGTLPTNWGYANIAGLTRSVVGVGTENGLPFIDIRINGTASGSNINIFTSLNISASSSQVWSNSAYIKIIAQPNPPLFYRFQTVYENGGTYVNESVTAYTPTTTLSRFTATHTAPASTITSLYQSFSFALTIGQTYDFTIRIAAPQMELGAYATTWVPTTTAAVTRLADAASKTGVSSLIGQTEGTLYWEGTLRTLSLFQDIFGAGVFADNVFIRLNSSNQIQSVATNAGTVNVLGQSTTITSGSFKIAFAYKNGSHALVINGGTPITSTATSVIPASMSLLNLGNMIRAATLEGSVSQAALFPTRLTNATLAQMTTL